MRAQYRCKFLRKIWEAYSIDENKNTRVIIKCNHLTHLVDFLQDACFVSNEEVLFSVWAKFLYGLSQGPHGQFVLVKLFRLDHVTRNGPETEIKDRERPRN